MTAPEAIATNSAVADYEKKQQENKEYNFRQLEQKLQQERQARLEAEKRAEEALKMSQRQEVEEEDNDEPYVDHKRLNKKLSTFEKTMEQKIEQKAEVIARNMVEKQKNDIWLKANPDFQDTIVKYADQFAKANPDLAEAILEMPDTFERQKLVYKNIKALGLDRPPAPVSTIQDKVDANRRSPYYQPSGIGTAPYNANQGDFSAQGQELAYKKMKELQNKLYGRR